MFSLKNNLKFISIDQKYLKYLHDFCKEVYWQPVGYETKPYLGILVEDNGNEYVIPLSSAKEKHKYWNNVETDRFLIYEISNKKPTNFTTSRFLPAKSRNSVAISNFLKKKAGNTILNHRKPGLSWLFFQKSQKHPR